MKYEIPKPPQARRTFTKKVVSKHQIVLSCSNGATSDVEYEHLKSKRSLKRIMNNFHKEPRNVHLEEM
jgi:hypothetical protein